MTLEALCPAGAWESAVESTADISDRPLAPDDIESRPLTLTLPLRGFPLAVARRETGVLADALWGEGDALPPRGEGGPKGRTRAWREPIRAHHNFVDTPAGDARSSAPPLASRSRPRTETAALLVCGLATEALRREVLLTPKPGLVDRRNSGAHRDMTLATFMASGAAIRAWFPLFFDTGVKTASRPIEEVLPRLRPNGLACETAMFAATKGVNTHKGAIFSLGLLIAAAGRRFALAGALKPETICSDVASMTADLVEDELKRANRARTAGETLFRRHGLTGARGEAASGFATVRVHALPVFVSTWLRTGDERLALSAALLALLAHNRDTNLVARGGMDGLAYVQASAKKLIDRGGAQAPDFHDAMTRLDDDLIARNLSPGGSADLLAVTWFLAKLPAIRQL